MTTKKLPAMVRVLCDTVPTTPVTTRRPKSPGPTGSLNVDWCRPPGLKGQTRIELPAVVVWANLAPGKDRDQDRYRCTRCQSTNHTRA